MKEIIVTSTTAKYFIKESRQGGCAKEEGENGEQMNKIALPLNIEILLK